MRSISVTWKFSDATNAPLEDVLGLIERRTKADVAVNVVVNWKALENAGVDRNTQVTIHLSNVPLRKALRLILGQTGPANLNYEVENNVITISTREDLNTETVMRVHNVRDLLRKRAIPNGPPDLSVQQTPQQVNPSPAATNPATADAPAIFPTEDDISKLKEILMSVDPETWRANGGSVGSIVDFHGLLTITTTREIHAKIEKLLATLRTADKEGNDGPASDKRRAAIP